jgi:hypothetical protein
MTSMFHKYERPKAPAGYVACRTHNGDQRLVPIGASIQITHLVELDELGSNGGRPTMCGLTRFDKRNEAYEVTRPADLLGWGMGDSGVYGPNVEQVECEACYSEAAERADHEGVTISTSN